MCSSDLPNSGPDVPASALGKPLADGVSIWSVTGWTDFVLATKLWISSLNSALNFTFGYAEKDWSIFQTMVDDNTWEMMINGGRMITDESPFRMLSSMRGEQVGFTNVSGWKSFKADRFDELYKTLETDDEADYTKGNRFLVDAKEVMPNKRYIGNILLSILTRMASGVHTVFDTQDGFTAISKKVIETVNWDLFWDGYGYVSDFIIKLAAYGFRIKDVPRRSIYLEGEKQSKIVISRYIKRNFLMILKGWWWRIFHQRKIKSDLKTEGK